MKTPFLFRNLASSALLLTIILMSSCASQKFNHNAAYKFSHYNYNKTNTEDNLGTTLAANEVAEFESPTEDLKNNALHEEKTVELDNATITPNLKSSNTSIAGKNEFTPSSNLVQTKNDVDYSTNENESSTKKFLEKKKVVKLKKKFFKEVPEPDPSKNWAAIASLPVGIVSLLVAGVLLGPTAIVFGALGLKSEKKGLAIAGLVLGIIGVIGALIVISSM